MKKDQKARRYGPRPSRSETKARENNPVFKAAVKAGLDPIHPYVPEGVSRAPGAAIAIAATTFKRPEPDPQGWVACGACRHGEASSSKFVCRSFLSPRAGFMHERKFACGYGRARELVEA